MREKSDMLVSKRSERSEHRQGSGCMTQTLLREYIQQSGKVCYCRVSSHKQKDDLERQSAFMSDRCPGYEIVTDIGSGLNFGQKGLLALLESVCSGNVGEAVVARKDRLCRFGFDLIRRLVGHHGGKLVVLGNVSQSPQSELVADLPAAVTVFSCRMHGLRKYRTEIKKDKTLSE